MMGDRSGMDDVWFRCFVYGVYGVWEELMVSRVSMLNILGDITIKPGPRGQATQGLLAGFVKRISRTYHHLCCACPLL